MVCVSSMPDSRGMTVETIGTLHMLSGAALLEAVYYAIENHPENCYVNHILRQS